MAEEKKLPHSCGSCDRRWVGLQEAHCPVCHRQFSNIANADDHRQHTIKRGQLISSICLDPAKVKVPKTRKPRYKSTMRAGGEVWVSYYERKEDDDAEA